MTDDGRRSSEPTQAGPASDRLDSWKEIGAYLKRDATTVRRWEKREGLPVHRHPHDRRDSVYAYRHEIDRWWEDRRNGLADKVTATAAPTGGRERLAWIAVAALTITTGVMLTLLLSRGPANSAVMNGSAVRLAIQPTERVTDFALSPDGRVLTFVGTENDDSRLWIRQLDAATAQPLAGTEGAGVPFWSPDSRFIAFMAGGKLKKIAATGGAVHTLCDAPAGIGGTWSGEDVIVFASGNRTPLYRVAASGGEPVQVTTLDASLGHNTHRWPHFLPDGRRFLYLARSPQPENSGIYVGSLDSPEVTKVMSGESRMEYAAPGYLLFARDRALLAQPFDWNRLRLHGEPIQVLDDVLYNRDDSHAGFSVSRRGEMAYQTGAAVPRSALVWFDRAGRALESPPSIQDAYEPSLSPDGERVAFTRSTGPSKDLWVVDRAKGDSRITSHPSVEYIPVWSPDGQSIMFASNRDGPSDLYRISSNGTGEPELLVRSNAVKHPSDWSLAAEVIVYDHNDPESGWDLWTLSLGPDRTATPFLRTEFAEGFGRLSPDGRWMAYVSNESGSNEVFVRPFPQSNHKTKVSTTGGIEPRWRGDGKELFYRTPDGNLMAVAVETRPAFRASAPVVLFATRINEGTEWSYDVTRDGQRFVCSVPVGEPTPAPVMIFLNWTTALSRVAR